MKLDNKPVVRDNRLSYVYYIKGSNEIFGSWVKLHQPLASISDVQNHREIWDCPIQVQEGRYRYEKGQYRYEEGQSGR